MMHEDQEIQTVSRQKIIQSC